MRDNIINFAKYISMITLSCWALYFWATDNKKAEQYLFNLSHSSIEIVCVLVICIYIYFIDAINQFVKNTFNSLAETATMKGIVLFAVFGFLIYYSITIKTIAQERFHHLKNWDVPYKYDQYDRICANLKEGNYMKTIEIINKFKEQCPDEKRNLDRINYEISDRIAFSDELQKRKTIFIDPDQQQSNSLKRNEFFKTYIAFCYHPTKEYRDALESSYTKLNNSLSKASTFYDAYIDRDSVICNQILNEWDWLLFENDILDDIRKVRKNYSFDDLSKLLKNKSKEDFIEITKNSWHLLEVEEALKYRPTIRVGKSLEYFAKDTVQVFE